MTSLKHYSALKQLGSFSWRRSIAIVAVGATSLVIELSTLAIIPPIVQVVSEQQAIATGPAASSGILGFVPYVLDSVGIPATLEVLLVLLAVALLVRQIVVYIEAILIERQALWTIRSISSRLFQSWLAGPTEVVQKIGTGTWVTMFVRHCSIAARIVPAYARFIRSLATIVVFLGVALLTRPILVLVAIAFALLLYVPLRFTIKAAKAASRKMIERQNSTADFLLDCGNGWRQARIFDLVRELSERFTDNIDTINAAQREQTRATALAPVIIVSGLIVFVGLFIQLAPLFGPISLPEIALLGVLALRVLPMLQALTSRIAAIALSGQSLDYVLSTYLDLIPSRELAKFTTKSLGPIEKCIDFSNVSFSYISGQGRANKDITLRVPAKKLIGIRGRSGSGKSTFVDLVSCFLRPSSGEIEYDGEHQSQLPARAIMKQIALATQDPFIFQGTVEDNIRSGNRAATRNEVEAAARDAGIHDTITTLPNSYSTVVGQTGHGLSGGQKQRLALARMFLSEASVLIFDEPTSALDNDLELEIIEAIRSHTISKQKTTLIITHRESVWNACDLIIEFDDGTAAISEQATSNSPCLGGIETSGAQFEAG